MKLIVISYSAVCLHQKSVINTQAEELRSWNMASDYILKVGLLTIDNYHVSDSLCFRIEDNIKISEHFSKKALETEMTRSIYNEYPLGGGE